VNDAVVDAAYAAGWSVVRGMPERLARAQFDAVADAVWLRGGDGVDRLRANLRRVKPDLDDHQLRVLTRAAVRSYLRYWCEVFRLPRMSRDDVVGRMFVVDEQRLRDAVAAGNGVILALPHMGNWDHAGAWLTGTGVPFTTVAERLEPEALFARFVAFRESLGMEVLPLTGGAVQASQVLQDRLRAGRVVCLLGDRDLTSRGVPVDFFGERTRMPAGPAMLAALTGADLLRAHLTFTATGWHNLICPPLPLPGERLAQQVRGGTQLLADGYATGIRARPADWHMLQPLWEADLPADRRALLDKGRPHERAHPQDSGKPRDKTESAEAQP
jgi:phosphatidylinositol dimannoside acyltransferase